MIELWLVADEKLCARSPVKTVAWLVDSYPMVSMVIHHSDPVIYTVEKQKYGEKTRRYSVFQKKAKNKQKNSNKPNEIFPS